MAEMSPRVLALHIAAGSVYGAVVACPDTLEPGLAERMQLSDGLEGASQLADFAARFRQQLREIAPVAVGVVNTRKYASWKYADAFTRISVEAAIMLTVADASTTDKPVRYSLIKQESMAKKMEIPLQKLVEVATERWGDVVTRYRQDRLLAVVGAFALAKDVCG